TAFAHSCNTTFAGLASRLPARALEGAARKYGIGAGWQLPVPSFSGSLPPPAGEVERAADAIGQGRVLVSPLAMALVAAAVDRGGGQAGGRPFRHRLRVRYAECDRQGHVFNSHYFAYFDVVLTELWRAAIGYYDLMIERGVDVVVGEAQARYLRAAHFDDE